MELDKQSSKYKGKLQCCTKLREFSLITIRTNRECGGYIGTRLFAGNCLFISLSILTILTHSLRSQSLNTYDLNIDVFVVGFVVVVAVVDLI